MSHERQEASTNGAKSEYQEMKEGRVQSVDGISLVDILKNFGFYSEMRSHGRILSKGVIWFDLGLKKNLFPENEF